MLALPLARVWSKVIESNITKTQSGKPNLLKSIGPRREAGGVSTRTAAWLALAICLLALSLTALGLFFLTLNLSNPKVDIYDYWVEITVIAVAFSAVGAVVASRCPENPFGWIYCAIGLVGGIRLFSAEYAAYTLLAAPGSLPGGEVAAWTLSWIWLLHLGLFAFSCLLFPKGLPPRDRWRRFALFSGAVFAAGSIAVAFSPGPVNGLHSIENPLGVEAIRGIESLFKVLGHTLTLIAAVSLFERLRYTRGIGQQQIKWVTYASAVGAGGAIVLYVVSPHISLPWLFWPSFVIVMLGLVGAPLTMGNAILRYRLFDIDVIINRTLVYAVLTATLALVYFGGVALLQGLLRALSGQESLFAQYQLAVVASTLAVAALFGPLRRRVQVLIDRRFYRSKYDAARTLNTFGAKVRDEVDLEKLTSELVAVIDQTVQPTHVSLWLRPPQRESTNE